VKAEHQLAYQGGQGRAEESYVNKTEERLPAALCVEPDPRHDEPYVKQIFTEEGKTRHSENCGNGYSSYMNFQKNKDGCKGQR
jgi:hypothetical protein